jgi:hypothetical protein
MLNEPVKVVVDARPVALKPEAPPPAAVEDAAPPVETKVEPPRDDAGRFAKLARIEAKNRAREREIRQVEAQLEARAKAVLEQEARFKAAKDDPRKLADIYGDKYYERITEAQLNGGQLTAEQVAQQALDEARQAREEVGKRQADFVKQQQAAIEAERQAYVDNYGTTLLKYVQADPVKYAALGKMQSKGVDIKSTLLETQMEYFRRTGKALGEHEALGLVEKFYRDLASEIGTATAAEQLTAKAPPAQPPRASQPSRSAPQGTLTNSLTSAPTVPPSPRPRTAVERALAAMEAASAARTSNG